MQRLSSCFFILYVLNTSSRRYIPATPGGAALASLPGVSCGMKACALIDRNKTVVRDHDPWD